MASDKQQVERMESHRALLLAETKLSVPADVGRVAIVTMYNPARAALKETPENGLDAMQSEARRLRGYLKWRGRVPAYLPEATVEEFWEVIDDVRVSDIVVIGLGQLGRVQCAPWTRESAPTRHEITMGFYDAISRNGQWPTISHLKTGRFYQRTSGLMHKNQLNVPFAWGFMAHRTNIWALPQMGFYPGPYHLRPSAGLVKLTEYFELGEEIESGMTYSWTKEIFGQRPELTPRRYPVPKFALPAYERLRQNPKVLSLHNSIREKIFQFAR